MKTLVFSDTHLSHKFDQKKFDFLKKIITDADRVIINGDFWDSWLTNLDKFLDSQWKPLFPLLLNKKAVYIHGNHDATAYCGRTIIPFAISSVDSYQFTQNDTIFTICHGHQLLQDNRTGLLKLYTAWIKNIEAYSETRIILRSLDLIGNIFFRLMGFNGLAKMENITNSNTRMKQFSRSPSDSWLICADSHMPEIDYAQKYANSGCILRGHASYLTIEKEQPQLHYYRY
jgi:predicted phosphodiesterase